MFVGTSSQIHIVLRRMVVVVLGTELAAWNITAINWLSTWRRVSNEPIIFFLRRVTRFFADLLRYVVRHIASFEALIPSHNRIMTQVITIIVMRRRMKIDTQLKEKPFYNCIVLILYVYSLHNFLLIRITKSFR